MVGRLGERPDPLVLVGGNCALQGFDADGNDPYWNVTGDNIRSMALIDINQSGQNQVRSPDRVALLPWPIGVLTAGWLVARSRSKPEPD